MRDREASVSRETFQAMIAPLLDPAFRTAYGLLHNPHDAEEAVQESLLSAWRNIHQYDSTRNFRPWLMKIVVNRCRAVQRTRWWKTPQKELSADLQTGGWERDFVESAHIRQALKRIDYDQQVVVVLHFYVDMTLADIADLLDIPVGTVKSRLFRATKKLKEHLAPDFQEALA